MIRIDIPGFGPVELKHLVTDFTGTLSEDGRLCEGVGERLSRLSGDVEIHVLTADTFGRAREEFSGINCAVHILEGRRHDQKKEKYVGELGPAGVFAVGNGKNDALMLKAARVGVAVCLKEGCAADAAQAADVLVSSAADALGLLLHPMRLKATLRF